MPGQMMTCGPCAGPEPHRYTGDTWVCATCEHRRQEATIKALVETVLYAEKALEMGTVAAREAVTAKIAKLRTEGRIP